MRKFPAGLSQKEALEIYAASLWSSKAVVRSRWPAKSSALSWQSMQSSAHGIAFKRFGEISSSHSRQIP
jgi:hypothetical protein